MIAFNAFAAVFCTISAASVFSDAFSSRPTAGNAAFLFWLNIICVVANLACVVAADRRARARSIAVKP